MHSLVKLALVALLLGPPAIAADSPIAGKWSGKLYDLPGIDLTVKLDDSGKLSGTILFYFLHRNTEHEAWQVDMKHSMTLPLIDPKFDGKTLTFQVSHKEAHPPRTLNDPPSSFQMRLTEKGVGELLNLTEKNSPALKMVRDPTSQGSK
jgi:hypothetical protein